MPSRVARTGVPACLPADDGAVTRDDPRLVVTIRRMVSLLVRWSWRMRANRCLRHSITCYEVLRPLGIEAQIHFGVRKGSDGALLGHSWVTSGDEVLTTHEDLSLYTETHVHPAGSPPGE